MPGPLQPKLIPGRVYRTQEFGRWTKNPPRLAKRLAETGKIVPLGRGLFVAPSMSRFGMVPPADDELVRAFLGTRDFVFTGPEKWNALGLGTTALFATPLIYNKKRSGTFQLGQRRFTFRRVAFPAKPSPEWYVIDLLENAEAAGGSREIIASSLPHAIQKSLVDAGRLQAMAQAFGTQKTQKLISESVRAAR